MRGSVETTALLYRARAAGVPHGLPGAVSNWRRRWPISTLLTLLGQQDSGRRGATTLSPAGRRLIVDFVAGGLARIVADPAEPPSRLAPRRT